MIILLALLLTSHLLAAIPTGLRILGKKMPSTSDFASLSVILYYDIGLIFEALDGNSRSAYFSPLLDAADVTQSLALVILASAPWLFHTGSMVATGFHYIGIREEKPRMDATGSRIFFILCVLVCTPLLIMGLLNFSVFENIWVVRARVAREWGPLIVILYMPLNLLAFYVGQANSSTRWGLVCCIALALATIASTISIGQRTLVLLPFLIIALFRFKLSFARMILVPIGGLIGASLLLMIFKWQYSGSEIPAVDLVARTILDDFSRSEVLAKTIENSEWMGTKILAYPMAGYVYCGLFYLPRSLVPIKGYPTAQYFTGFVLGTSVETTDWGFGVGAIEEILINGGLLMLIPLMLVYGMAMGLADKVSRRIPSVLIPTRLAALWICGYGLSSLMLLYGLMAFVGLTLHYLLSSGDTRLVHGAGRPLAAQLVQNDSDCCPPKARSQRGDVSGPRPDPPGSRPRSSRLAPLGATQPSPRGRP